MATTATKDIISQLLDDHQQVKDMFATGTGNDPEPYFWELTNALVRHEVAEEEVLYPEVRKSMPNGEMLAKARIDEKSEAEELLAKMQKAGVDDPQFGADLERLRGAVLAHAQKEEQTIFTPLGQILDAGRREELGERYEKAKAAAPAHPHPHAPDSPPGNMVLGPIAALVDRTRDAMHRVVG